MGNGLARLDLGSGATIASIHGDLTGSCAILKDQRIKCWGNNQHGQLGLGDNVSRGNVPGQMGNALPSIDLGVGVHATDVHIGFHTCARLDNATLKCWGANGAGQLGLGDVLQRGSMPGQMGSALPTVNLGSGLTVRDVSLGYLHSCAITSANLVKCWGWGDMLGLEDRTDRGFASDMGDALPYVRLGTGRTVKAIRARVGHTCAILDDDSLKCWGSNETGELGQGDTASRGVFPGTMGDALLPINLGAGRTVRAVALGLGFTCAILDNGGVKCWGDPAEGRLGLGELVPQGPRGIAPGQMGDALPYVNLGTGRTAKQITSGLAFTCALLDNDTVKCWGANDAGQLGQGDDRTRGGLNTDMGDALLPVDFGVF